MVAAKKLLSEVRERKSERQTDRQTAWHLLKVVRVVPVAEEAHSVCHHPNVAALTVEVRFGPVPVIIQNVNGCLPDWGQVGTIIQTEHRVA